MKIKDSKSYSIKKGLKIYDLLYEFMGKNAEKVQGVGLSQGLLTGTDQNKGSHLSGLLNLHLDFGIWLAKNNFIEERELKGKEQSKAPGMVG